MIPRTYEDWHRCITVDCGITLTHSFVLEPAYQQAGASPFSLRKRIPRPSASSNSRATRTGAACWPVTNAH